MSVTPTLAARAADLSLQHLEKRYGSIIALKPLSIDIPAGTFLTVLGPSGSGKTTVLRLIGGFSEPTAGRIVLGGEDITELPIFQRPCNTVFQDYALFPHLNVSENVGYGLSVRGRPKSEINTRVEEILTVVGLQKMAGRAPSQLSGGQRQRVALARALICDPRIMLLDEPLAALDAELRHQMQEFLKAQQRRSGITFLFVTHDQQEAIGISDLILVMRGGVVEQVASPRDLYYRPQTHFVASFFGENNLIEGTIASRQGDEVCIDTKLGSFVAANPNGCTVGQRASMAVRPESFTVQPDAGKPPNSKTAINGVIHDTSFSGSATRVTVRVASGLLTTTVASDRNKGALHTGDKVILQWSPGDAIVVAADDTIAGELK